MRCKYVHAFSIYFFQRISVNGLNASVEFLAVSENVALFIGSPLPFGKSVGNAIEAKFWTVNSLRGWSFQLYV